MTAETRGIRICRSMLLIVVFAASAAAEGPLPGTVHHDLIVRLAPEGHRLEVVDTLTVPETFPDRIEFVLHEGLAPASRTPGVEIRRGEAPGRYSALLPAGIRTFSVAYAGTIHHPLEPYGKEQARGFRVTRGIISEEGVYLAGDSAWYPVLEGHMLTAKLRVEMPPGWQAVSQGDRTISDGVEREIESVEWGIRQPQEEIYLVAAPFTVYADRSGRIETMAFLRTPDDALAARYLAAAAQYLTMYEGMIGPYPYGKFALVENFWETGWGMPSFTLLGPKIIRFPFILHSSYPHEILHTWWGNGVYPDYERGNWSEGLTAYLADHLIKEQQGKGREHRLTVLQKYADYVSRGKDFPLTEFTSRHSSSSEAVGYGKSLMFFHMLRRSLGDGTFVRGLQAFYRDNRFRTASFEELRKAFEQAAGRDLGPEFRQWTTRVGAPGIRVKSTRVHQDEDGFVAAVEIEQTQAGTPYDLEIPLAFTVEGDAQAHVVVVKTGSRVEGVRMHFASRPLRLDVDPEFDLFRRVDLGEVPPAISQVLGSDGMLIILPETGTEGERKALRDFAEALAEAGPEKVQIRGDSEVAELPDTGSVALLGRSNRFRDAFLPVVTGAYDVDVTADTVSVEHTTIPFEGHSIVLVGRKKDNPAVPLMWIAADVPEALPGLARKLPHYHKYSYLAFEGSEPDNVAKGRWPVMDSPLTVFLPLPDGSVHRIPEGRLPERPALAQIPVPFSSAAMMETVRFLADAGREGRGLGTEGLDRSSEFIARGFRDAGLIPAGDGPGTYFQEWEEKTGPQGEPLLLRNVIGMIPGADGRLSDRRVVVGAHYDHLGRGWPEPREERFRGEVHPGADDNASGVAVLMELARVMAGSMKPARDVLFVAFTGEEAGRLGSRHFIATQSASLDQAVFAMLNLDTVGRLGTGRLLVLGGESAREWVHIFRGAGYVTGVEVQIVSEPLDASDQQSFIEASVPAVQLFSGPHSDYHRPLDIPDRLDESGLVKVAAVAREVIEYLAGRAESLTVRASVNNETSARRKTRNVSLGIVPDFAFSGPGCRLAGVLDGSPAETCGLREGDVIIAIEGVEIGGLRDLSDVLKGLVPGQEVAVRFLRGGVQHNVKAAVIQR